MAKKEFTNPINNEKVEWDECKLSKSIEDYEGRAERMARKDGEHGEGRNEEAIDVAFKALFELKEDLGGENSILLLPGYFVLAEANIAENKLKKAEEFLIAAYWNFLKS